MAVAGLLSSVFIWDTLSSHCLALIQWDIDCPGQLCAFSVPTSGPGKCCQPPASESSQLHILQWVDKGKHIWPVLGSPSPVELWTGWLPVHPRQSPMLPLWRSPKPVEQAAEEQCALCCSLRLCTSVTKWGSLGFEVLGFGYFLFLKWNILQQNNPNSPQRQWCYHKQRTNYPTWGISLLAYIWGKSSLKAFKNANKSKK